MHTATAVLVLSALLAGPAAAQGTKTVAPPPDVAAVPQGAAKTASGLASRVIKPGTGKTHPGKSDLRNAPILDS
jgi:hypothetical protein